MNIIEEAIATLGIPGSIAVVIVVVFAVLQLIGEFIEACGKVAPTFLKLRKIIKKRREKKQAMESALQAVQQLLTDMNNHYSEDNIAKRNDWIQWVNDRALIYDAAIKDYKETAARLAEALDNNTKMTEHMFAENSRDRIIDFASKLVNTNHKVSKEEFARIFKIFRNYEKFLVEHNMTNGEVELNYQIIQDSYKERTLNGEFLENYLE